MRVVPLVVAVALLSSLVYAIPGFPHQLFGEVEVNNASAPDGTLVIAKVNGVEFARTTTKGGRFGYDPVFAVSADDVETVAVDGARDGEFISIYVRNGTLLARIVQFEQGAVSQLRLDVDYDVPCADECAAGSSACTGRRRYDECGNYDTDACLEKREVACPSGQECKSGACVAQLEPDVSTSTPAGCFDECAMNQFACRDGKLASCGNFDSDGCLEYGNPIPCSAGDECRLGQCVPLGAPVGGAPGVPPFAGPCEPSWLCGDWGSCVSGVQTRECTDFNACGSLVGRPATSRSCEAALPPVGPCVERWECAAWSPCVSGVRSRSCSDQNACGTFNQKYLYPEQEPCELPALEQPTELPSAPSAATGLVVWLVAIGVVIVLVAGGLTYWLHERVKESHAVRSYIHAMRDRKYPDDQIELALLQAGWKKSLVEAELRRKPEGSSVPGKQGRLRV